MSSLLKSTFDIFTRSKPRPALGQAEPENGDAFNGDKAINFTNTHGIRVCGVVDGAISPFKYLVDGKPSDIYASEIFRDLLQEAFENVSNLESWEQGFQHCIDGFKEKFDNVRMSHPEFCEKDYRVFNGACVFALSILDENTGDCVVLNAMDCYACAYQNNGIKNLSHYDDVAFFESGLVDRSSSLKGNLAAGMPKDEAEKIENARIIGNRERAYNKCRDGRNKVGMPVMNGDSSLMNCVQIDHFNIHEDNIEGFVFVTDGYAQDQSKLVEYATGAYENGAEAYFDNNLKVIDDTSCVVVKF